MSVFQALFTSGLNFRLRCEDSRIEVAVGSERHGWLPPIEASSLQDAERKLDQLARECFPGHRYASQPVPAATPMKAFQELCDRRRDFDFVTLWDGSNIVRIDGKEVLKQESPDFEALEQAVWRFLDTA
jgi:hypothetical protein